MSKCHFWRVSILAHWRRCVLVLVLASLAGHLFVFQMPSSLKSRYPDASNEDDSRAAPPESGRQLKMIVTPTSNLNSATAQQEGSQFRKKIADAAPEERETEALDGNVNAARVQFALAERGETAAADAASRAKNNEHERREQDVKDIKSNDHYRQQVSRENFGGAAQGERGEAPWQERELEYQRRNERIRRVCQNRNVQITSPPVITHHNFTTLKSAPGVDEGKRVF